MEAVEMDLSSRACQNPDMQQAQIEDIEVSLDENLDGHYMDYKKVVDWGMITLVVHRLNPVDIR
jgi:hypothetical protein